MYNIMKTDDPQHVRNCAAMSHLVSMKQCIDLQYLHNVLTN